MPNSRKPGTRVRGFAIPDTVYLPAREKADRQSPTGNLSAVVAAALEAYTQDES